MNTALFSTRHITSTAASDLPPSDPDRPVARERALVLGGGGATGNAWLIGVLAGLFDGGLDVTAADLIIGTSAGATTAAQIAGAAPADLYAALLGAGAPPQPAGPGRRTPGGLVADHMARTGAIIAAAADPADMRRRMAAAALELEGSSDPAAQRRWHDIVAGRLPGPHWPDRAVVMTAVDADTGEPVVFDRSSGVDLADAVAASCAGGFAYRIGDHRYVDGGYRRSSENADLAAGYPRVLVLSPLGGRSRAPQEWGMHLAAQVDELRAGGSRVETVLPEGDAEGLLGANAMDLSLRVPAALAGHDQGRALAEQLTAFWR
jgi:NTE family protein